MGIHKPPQSYDEWIEEEAEEFSRELDAEWLDRFREPSQREVEVTLLERAECCSPKPPLEDGRDCGADGG